MIHDSFLFKNMLITTNSNHILNFNSLFFITVLLFSLPSCTNDNIHLKDRSPFLIAPMIEGIDLCKQAIDVGIHEAAKALQYCNENDFYNTALLSNLLDSFEPQGAQGQVIIGYTYGVSLLGLYNKNTTGEWQIQQDKIDRIVKQITAIDRPIILYLLSNHFDSGNALAIELSKNEKNLMVFQEGEIIDSQYFTTRILPFTLNSDASIPVNQYRYKALKEIATKLLKMPPEHFSKIKAITLNGEAHHLFNNFKAGPSFNSRYRVSDYSDLSVNKFRQWLKHNFTNIYKFNQATGYHYTDFEQIIPPSKNINAEINIPTDQHIDHYSTGEIPIHGWLWDENKIISDIFIVLDNQIKGTATRHFNRLDVYQAVEEVNTPNVGFSYPLNFSNLMPGSHTLSVVAKDTLGRFFMMRSKVIDIAQGAGRLIIEKNPSNYQELCRVKDKQTPCITLEDKDLNSLNIKFWVDSFDYNHTYIYNKLSRLWLTFKQDQVSDYMDNFARLAISFGLPKELLFSHQILSGANSDWDDDMLASEKSISGKHPYNIGVNLYGGSQYTQAFNDVLANRAKIEKLGIPEYHPQLHKNKQEILNSLLHLYAKDVDFIVPYFISMVPDSMRSKNKGHDKFLIVNNNSQYGSGFFYQSIVDMASK